MGAKLEDICLVHSGCLCAAVGLCNPTQASHILSTLCKACREGTDRIEAFCNCRNEALVGRE